MISTKKIKHFQQCIKDNEPFHEQIPNVGKIIFNKVVPYFFLYRVDNKEKDSTIEDLAKSQLGSLIIQHYTPELDMYIMLLAKALKEKFGSCLIIECWVDDTDNLSNDIQIHLAQKPILPIAEYFLRNIQQEAPDLRASIEKKKETPTSPNFGELFGIKPLQLSSIYVLGISIKKNYCSIEGKILPLLQRHYRESLGKSLSRVFFEFIRLFTEISPATFKLNTNKDIKPIVFEIDKALSQISQKFDFLFLVTPINVDEAFASFKKSRFTQKPHFQYRPMPIDPDIIKRKLYNLPIEDIYDPTVAYLFRDKRREVDEMMSMLAYRNSQDFVHGSLQVFGNVSDKLLQIAQAILTIIEDQHAKTNHIEKKISAQEFASIAKKEIQYLHQQAPEFNTTVRIRNDVSGIMVNRGVLNISPSYEISADRVQALIQHEVGTHISTYFNGKAQPLQLFSLGVPGYEQLQEGLAVFAEYMVDGLTNDRLRTLAARVISVRHMLMGYSFIDTFFLLVDQYHFKEYAAFTIAMRVYRGGGLTKDALYLQGLIELIDYIRDGHDIKLLTIGKIRRDYLPIIQDLIQRGYMNPPRIIPRYLSDEYLPKLKSIQKDGSVFKLIQ